MRQNTTNTQREGKKEKGDEESGRRRGEEKERRWQERMEGKGGVGREGKINGRGKIKGILREEENSNKPKLTTQ